MSPARGFALVFLAFIFLFAPGRALQIISLGIFLIYALDYLYLLVLSRGIVIERRDSEIRSYRDERFVVELVIENRSRLPLLGGVITDLKGTLVSDGQDRRLIDIGPRRKLKLNYRLLPRERGEFSIGPSQMRIHDFFGVMEKVVKVKTTTKLIVYPRVMATDFKPLGGMPQGTIKIDNPIYEDLTNYRSVRPYLPGDEFKRINWKASARQGSLITNEYEPSLSAPLFLVLNLTFDLYPVHLKYHLMETAIEATAALATQACLNRQVVGFASTGTIGEDKSLPLYKPESGNLLPLLESLARIGPRKTDYLMDKALLEFSTDLPLRSRFAYIGPEIEGGLVDCMSTISDRGLRPEFYFIGLSNESMERYLARGFPVTRVEEITREGN